MNWSESDELNQERERAVLGVSRREDEIQTLFLLNPSLETHMKHC